MFPLALLLLAVLAAALPNPTSFPTYNTNTNLTPASVGGATLTFAPNDKCDYDAAVHISSSSGCVRFPAGAESLRVVGVDGDVEYNSRKHR